MKPIRSILLLVVLMSLIMVPVIGAQGSEPPQVPPPPANGWFVLDQLGWFTPAQVDLLNKKILKLKQETTAEIGVVTLNDCGGDHPKFRNDLFRKWGIGNKAKNNGLLILVCWQDGGKSRTLEQEVGYGLEGSIPDLKTSLVAKQFFVSLFKQDGVAADKKRTDVQIIVSGDAGQALMNMVLAYESIIRGQDPDFIKNAQTGPSLPPIVVILVILIVIVLAILILAFLAEFLGGGGSSSGSIFIGGSGSSSSSSDSDSGGGGFGGGDSGGGGSSTGF